MGKIDLPWWVAILLLPTLACALARQTPQPEPFLFPHRCFVHFSTSLGRFS